MNLLARLVPTNFFVEKEKFFADPSYNPQFQYNEVFTDEVLTQYGVPKASYTELAEEILEKTFLNRNELDLFSMEGPLLTQTEVEKKVQAFLKMHQLQKRFQVVWSSSFVSRATIDSQNLKLRLPADFRKEGLIGMLYHEVGTHAIRRVNYEEQPWFKRKKKYGFGDYLRTEEGLASLHALIPHSYKSTFISAIRYVAVAYAQEHSFAELWDFLGRYIQDPERRWNVTFRQKRGINDTSQGGGFTKDLVYFEGTVDTWRWLNSHDFELKDLYLGKMGIQDVEKARELNPNFQPLLPSFFITNRDKYNTVMSEIGRWNGF